MIPVNPPPTAIPRYIPNFGNTRETSLRPFIGLYICVWLKNRRAFWFCPAVITSDFAFGYVWRSGKWTVGRLRLKTIDTFQ